MKALIKKHAKEGIWLEDVPMPEVGNNDVLVKIKKTAICGTDVHIYKWDEWAQKTIPVPMTTGHEFAGEIVELGSNVTDLQVGDIVSVRARSKSLETITNSIAASSNESEWLQWNGEIQLGKVVSAPERIQIPENIKEQLIVELYSK